MTRSSWVGMSAPPPWASPLASDAVSSVAFPSAPTTKRRNSSAPVARPSS
ncbi:MAG: hypothetical protein WKG00_33080 [Polyangiaceae bacterium]